MAGTLVFTAIVLLIWNVPCALKLFAFTISGVGYGKSVEKNHIAIAIYINSFPHR